jgi:hypothetical protein
MTFERVIKCLVKARLGDPDCTPGDVDAAALERGQGLLKTLSLNPTESVFDRNKALVEERFGRLRAFVAELPRSLPTENPGVELSINRTAIPLCRGSASGSVFTRTGSGSACRALVIQVLAPLTT